MLCACVCIFWCICVYVVFALFEEVIISDTAFSPFLDPSKLSWREVKVGGSSVLVLDSVQLGGCAKIIAFDMDDTLIRTKSGKKFPKARDDWQWWSSAVRKALRVFY